MENICCRHAGIRFADRIEGSEVHDLKKVREPLAARCRSYIRAFEVHAQDQNIILS